MRIRYVILALAALLLPASALAQPSSPASSSAVAPSHMAVARELIDIVVTSDALVEIAMSSAMAEMNGDPSMAPFMGVIRQWMTELFTSEDAKNAFARVYATHFTEAELRELLAFYRTPVGRKLAGLLPELTAQGAQVGQELAESRQADLMQRLEQRAAELENKTNKQ